MNYYFKIEMHVINKNIQIAVPNEWYRVQSTT